ncbi:ABC transporter permease [Nitriliruptor alkaliphilus]|uniref:ABC transporter permease n=1 Tax=Nitriliruptor alkaliphilus TaxID=427918 RepID=UPI000697F00C|nr:ABC transporter permease subunit [Nitriliruptor alkaliphilus]
MAIVVAWHLAVTATGVNRIVMPGPFDVVADLGLDYLEVVVPTLVTASVGLVVGTAAGTVLALLVRVWAVLLGVVAPGLVILRSIPLVILVPILAKMLPSGRLSDLVITTLLTLFPAFVLVASALGALPSETDRLAAAYGASKLRRLRFIHLPAAVPAAATALRLSAGLAMLAAIVAEFLTGSGGIGHELSRASARFDSPRSWGMAVAAAVIAVGLYRLASWVERAAHRP